MEQLEHAKKTAVIKRSVVLNGHKISVSLEDDFWHGLHEIAGDEHMTVPMLVERIDRSREICNLSSAIGVFVFNYLRREIGTVERSPFVLAPKKPPTPSARQQRVLRMSAIGTKQTTHPRRVCPLLYQSGQGWIVGP